ncbi:MULTISPECIES: Imm27 family immunity protein [unclassified Chelatococcus]|uniref:Imm27 family immunity protein n=1 Tax=unclassified Chelatococcus TaxID=2638111 RepID=UPI001BCA7A86|nr:MULTISPECIES: Imm27 family immunity protein [unclassified Chelatococcus]CAH1673588.1 hypothetical protein CHELA20_51085 [Hyphomicrobiales bacterium]MBS7738805.1 hypothetical protein [Chelatococcus sp. HY11]MBX3543209.1 hypothetical protein [Chelatococcus sp.]MCO5076665.1 Imm27 family immunity protein [Chelatococcus sp.]CAH1674155.1 hypothetical protein CHELA41_23925 [Hyphomicrobiales bacterium]
MVDTDFAVEFARLRHLEYLARQHGRTEAELSADGRPGSPCFHEALHTASCLADALASLARNAAVVTDPDFYRLAHRARENISNLFRALGAADILGDDQPADRIGADERLISAEFAGKDNRAIERRISYLTQEYLSKIAVSECGWSLLFRDPSDGRFWELTHPYGELEGGGARRLSVIRSEDAAGRYSL